MSKLIIAILDFVLGTCYFYEFLAKKTGKFFKITNLVFSIVFFILGFIFLDMYDDIRSKEIRQDSYMESEVAKYYMENVYHEMPADTIPYGCACGSNSCK